MDEIPCICPTNDYFRLLVLSARVCQGVKATPPVWQGLKGLTALKLRANFTKIAILFFIFGLEGADLIAEEALA
jgi:hypothetical protein